MGRGTTPVQAALLGRRPLGNDINPLSKLLVRPRLEPPSLFDVANALESVPWTRPVAIREDLLVFYHPETLNRLTNLRDFLLQNAPIYDPSPDPVLDWIRMVAINRLTGHLPGFFSVYTLPPNQAVSVDAQRKINAKRSQSPEPRDIARIIMKKSKSLLSDGQMPRHPSGKLLTGASTASHAVADGESISWSRRRRFSILCNTLKTIGYAAGSQESMSIRSRLRCTKPRYHGRRWCIIRSSSWPELFDPAATSLSKLAKFGMAKCYSSVSSGKPRWGYHSIA